MPLQWSEATRGIMPSTHLGCASLHMAPKQAMQCLLYFIISRGWWWNICKLNFTFRSTRESQHLKDSHGNYPLTAKNYLGE